MRRASRLLGPLLPALLLALLALGILWPLGLTNRVLAGIDAYTYFLPYWDYRIAELQAGRLPLWNPYLFLGVPFLANPQSAVLYPLHLLLTGMPATSALVWSAILHVWLAALFAYLFCRRSLACSRPAALLGGALFGFGGFTLARVENINQLNGLAWLPALMWLLDEAQRSRSRRARVRWSVALAVVVALQLLAGHTQTTFINLVGLLLFALARLIAVWRQGRPAMLAVLAPVAAIVPGVLLAAAQLLPTLELNPLGLRSGGLPYRQAVSFSLRPRLLLQSLLPPAGGGLGEAFGNEGYAEFSAYLGVGALVLALIGAVGVWRMWRAGRLNPAHIALLLLAAAGLFLALGVANPVYYLLWRFVPGFDLFRAPARWMALYTLGAAGLAAIGLDALDHRLSTITLPRRWLLPLVLVVAAFLAFQIYPRPQVVLVWALAAGATRAAARRHGQAPRCGAGWSAAIGRGGAVARQPCAAVHAGRRPRPRERDALRSGRLARRVLGPARGRA